MIQKLTIFLIAAFMLSGTINAQTKYTIKSYTLLVNGTSNVHDWSSRATSINVTGDFVINNGSIEKINSASVNVVAKSLKSTKNSDLMDERTYSTIKADKFPYMTFIMTKVASIQKNGAETIVTVNGNLTIAGVSKPIDLVLKCKVQPSGDLQITGSEKIQMSSFGIKPPSFMLGAMKVADEITISWDVLLKK